MSFAASCKVRYNAYPERVSNDSTVTMLQQKTIAHPAAARGLSAVAERIETKFRRFSLRC